MARTKADAYAKAGGKASRKTSIARPSSKSIKIKKGNRGGGVNPVVKRPVPKWQNPITNFFSKNDSDVEVIANGAGNKINDCEIEAIKENGNRETSSLDEPGCSKECTETLSSDEADLNGSVSDGESEDEVAADDDETCETVGDNSKEEETLEDQDTSTDKKNVESCEQS